MGSPVVPSQIEALQITEGESFCSALKKMAKLTYKVYQLVRFKYTVTGGFTEAYKAMICEVECPEAAIEEEEVV